MLLWGREEDNSTHLQSDNEDLCNINYQSLSLENFNEEINSLYKRMCDMAIFS